MIKHRHGDHHHDQHTNAANHNVEYLILGAVSWGVPVRAVPIGTVADPGASEADGEVGASRHGLGVEDKSEVCDIVG